MDEWHALSSEEALRKLGTRREGLGAGDAASRLQEHGTNELKEKPGRSPVSMLISQFKQFLILILIAAALISAALGELLDAGAIAVVVVLNACLGFAQEYKAERAVRALKKLASPKARVRRDGEEALIDVRELVPGDIIILETGDRIPADCRILESVNMQADESMLTGESKPVSKTAEKLKAGLPVADRKNLLYMGTVLTNGRGSAIVAATGMGTEIGKIAEMLQETVDEETPLEKRLDHLGKQIGVSFLAITGVVFIAGLLRAQPWFDMFLTSVALAVAAIPEGLPTIVTITLALGLGRMAGKKAIVRRLSAVETLGSTAVICSDKTGTLTKNEMTVRRVWCYGKGYDVSGEGYSPQGDFSSGGKRVDLRREQDLSLTLLAGALCSNAKLENGRGWHVFGDPTEGALLVAASKAGFDLKGLEKQHKRVAELPFDSERKMMSTVNRTGGKLEVYTKGATEMVLRECTHIMKEGKVVRITDADRKRINAETRAMATDALRVLAVAFRRLPGEVKRFSVEELESGLTFIGLAGMIDPPRAEAKAAVKLCKQAGMRAVMITGDHKDTAVAVARELGLLGPGALVVTGEELEQMSDAKLAKDAEHIAVYARVSPLHKQRIVKALRAEKMIIAMTGDGVNDAPALKLADIGVAMGITGTDVSKEASDMILLDDNFATIVAAVEEGRVIYDNIKKAVVYLLSCNIAEIMVMFFATVANLPLPLLPLQILWLNLVTDGLPALALAVEPASPDIMSKPPRDPKENVLTRRNSLFIATISLIVTVGTLGVFVLTLAGGAGLDYARTMAFTALVMLEHWLVLSMRSEDVTLRRIGLFSNSWMNVAFVSTFALQLAVIYLPPLQTVFRTVPLSLNDWILITAVSLCPFLLVEFAKGVRARFFRPAAGGSHR